MMFSLTGPSDLGQTNVVQHGIDTGSAKPIRQAQRRHPMAQRQEIDVQVKDLLAQGLIEPVASPWASNIVLVKEKDGSQRLCVDYRQLNAQTTKNAYPLPRIDEILDSLAGAKWFSTLDLARGYWQVELTEVGFYGQWSTLLLESDARSGCQMPLQHFPD